MKTALRTLLAGHEYQADAEALVELMQSGSTALKAPLCLHYYWPHCELPRRWARHANPICMRHQKQDMHACEAFCGPEGVVEKAVENHPDGYLHTCPFGCVKCAVPVTNAEEVVGTLFAGPLPDGKAARVAPKQMVCLVSALALKLGRMLHGDDTAQSTRRSEIRAFLRTRCEEPVTSNDLARALFLSPSRASHVVRDLFGCSFTTLLREARLAAAARCLRDTQLACAEIAQRFCFFDQSHFTRCFKAQYDLPPLKYRAEIRRKAQMEFY